MYWRNVFIENKQDDPCPTINAVVRPIGRSAAVNQSVQWRVSA
jgi:hypothetical protein